MLVVEAVLPRALGEGPCAGTGGGTSWADAGGVPFLELPKEKVRPARFRKPVDLGIGGTGISANGFR